MSVSSGELSIREILSNKLRQSVTCVHKREERWLTLQKQPSVIPRNQRHHGQTDISIQIDVCKTQHVQTFFVEAADDSSFNYLEVPYLFIFFVKLSAAQGVLRKSLLPFPLTLINNFHNIDHNIDATRTREIFKEKLKTLQFRKLPIFQAINKIRRPI